ncbi:hypothetical protein LWI29_012921 [Acer saccharum]|uniref:Uncharacterized protein n=1 Tax=Acer saccharum TaxID=4024 RepID=A0AA39VXM9_ACESA|nr:hypothetical protein LWI29_012921 [Acer saccharum]
MDKTTQTAQAAKDKTYQTAEAAKDKTVQAAKATQDKAGQATQATKDKTSDTADATKKKSQETGQATRDSAEAGKEKTGGILSQTGDQVKNMAQGATDAVKRTFGFDETTRGEDSEPPLRVLRRGTAKVWTVSSGFCFVTFAEHTNAVTALHFMANNHCLLSASLDGTFRAWDLFRYRNFRTFTAPSSRQFDSLAADQSGEVICAGTLDSFEIFVWSMKTGRLLDILSGHEGPVHDLAFSPTNVSYYLLTISLP